MADAWTEWGNRPLARELFKKVGLRPPPPLLRAFRPWSDELLAGKRLLINRHSSLTESLKAHLLSHRAQIDFATDREAEGATRAAPVAAYQGTFFDGTHLQTIEALQELFTFFQGQIRRMGYNHRVLVMLQDAPREAAPEARAAARAAEGFVRSLAKELGPKGVQVNTIRLGLHSPAIETVQAWAVFLLSDHCSFVTGQFFELEGSHWKSDQGPGLPELAGSLAGKRALVTGAAQGIGYAISRRLAEEGAHVLCLDRPENQVALNDLARSISGESLVLDLKNGEMELADRLQASHAHIDIVIHNAGITRDRSLFAMKVEQWDAVLGVNLEAPVRTTMELLRRGLIAPGGRVIAMSSIVGLAGNYGQSNYSAAKAGLIGLIEALAQQLASQGVTANAVAPGFIETPMTASLPFMAKQMGRRLSSLSQGGLPDDVAEMVCFLASPCSQGLSGRVVRVCGGNFLGA